jgi:Ca2+-transporting ATPase
MPTAKTTEVSDDSDSGTVTNLNNIAFMGTFVVSGRGMGVVICAAEQSEFGNVFKMMETMESPKTPLQKDMDTLGKQLSLYSMCIIGLIMLIGWLKGDSLLNMFTIGVSLAVAAIPEGLPIVVTVTLALGVMRMASHHAIVKKLPIVETLGCVTVVCSDKTGTLTENELTVTELHTTTGLHVSVTKDSVLVDGVSVTSNSHLDVSQVVEVGCVCSNVQVKEGGAVFGHPVDTALFMLAEKCGLAFTKDFYVKEEEIPFNSERKWMSVRVKVKTPQHTGFSGSSSVVMMKGALDRVLQHSTYISPSNQSQLEGLASEMGKKGLRVLALGKGPDLQHIEVLGLVGMVDPPREGVREAIQYLQDTGVSVKVITGDAKDTAISVGEKGDVSVVGVWSTSSS